MAPAYAVPRLLARNGLTPAGLRLLRDPRGVRVHGAGHAGGLGGRRRSARSGSAWTRRSARSTGRGSTSTARRWPPATRSPPPAGGSSPRWRSCCTRTRLRARADLDLRRRRPGRRRDPGGGRVTDTLPRASSTPASVASVVAAARAAPPGRAAPLPARRAAARRPGAGRRAAGDGQLAETLARVLDAAGVELHGVDDGDRRLAAVVVDATGVDGRRRPGRAARVPRPGPQAAAAVRSAAPARLDPRRRPAARPGRGPPGAGRAHPLGRQGGARAARRPTSSSSPTGRRRRSSRPCASSCPAGRRSSYGQAVQVGAPGRAHRRRRTDWVRPLDGRVAVVTGAARASAPRSPTCWPATAPRVVCVDMPAAGERLAASPTGSAAPRCSSTSPRRDAAERIAEHATEPARRARRRGPQRRHHPRQAARQHGRRPLGIGPGGQPRARSCASTRPCCSPACSATAAAIVCASSTSGIAGNRGQANYAASKAGVIGMVRAARARSSRRRGATINAVAPGLHRDRDDGRACRSPPARWPGGSTACARAGCRSTSPRRSRGSPRTRAPGSPARSCGSAARACWGPEHRS